jgi:hypothetical protein
MDSKEMGMIRNRYALKQVDSNLYESIQITNNGNSIMDNVQQGGIVLAPYILSDSMTEKEFQMLLRNLEINKRKDKIEKIISKMNENNR